MKNVLLVFFSLCALTLFGQNVQPDYVKGEVVIRFEKNIQVEKFMEQFNSEKNGFEIEFNKEVIQEWNMHLFFLVPSSTSVEFAVNTLNKKSGVANAFADRFVRPRKEPNDPAFFNQWALQDINVENVWDVTTGGTTIQGDEIVVAVADSGFDIDHPDLVENLWINKGEIPNDGIDNDNNGYIDDVHGYNFEYSTSSFDPTRAGKNHGTTVSGIIGAKGDNNQFHTGVNWNVKIMLLQVFRFSEVFEGYRYARKQRQLYNDTNGDEGAFVVLANSSFGTSGQCEGTSEWNMSFDSLGIEGVLSVVATVNASINVDLVGDIPSGCQSPYLLTVANVDRQSNLSNTGFGDETIDIGAPGTAMEVLGDNGVTNDSGTSLSTPYVSGAVSLLYSLPCNKLISGAKNNPAETTILMKDFILSGVDKKISLESKLFSGGRLNVEKSMNLIDNYCVNLIGDFEISNLYPNPASTDIEILYSVPNEDPIQIKVVNTLGELFYDEQHIPNPDIGGKINLVVGQLPAGTYFLQLWKDEIVKGWTFVKI